MTPGSQAARALGCICDPIKNANGLGTAATYINPMCGPEYVVASHCNLHGPAAWASLQVSPRGEERTIVSPITVVAARP